MKFHWNFQQPFQLISKCPFPPGDKPEEYELWSIDYSSILIDPINSIIKSTRSTSQKSKFYKRAVSEFLYTMRNQCGMFYSLYQEYELKILRVSVKLAYLDIYFTEKHARRRLAWLTVLLGLKHSNGFSNFRVERSENYWLY